MRILHISNSYAPRLGGIEAHVTELARRQAAAGHDVSVTTLTPPVADGREIVDDGLVTVRRMASLSGALADVTSFDVVHGHVSALSTFAAPLSAYAARRGVPTLVTVHSLWGGLGPLPRMAAAATTLRRAPVVWSAVSRLAAAQVAERLPPGRRVHVLPNAADVTPRPRTPGPRTPVSLVSTMRFSYRKRPLRLAGMFARLQAATDVPVELTVVGDGHLRPALERRMRRLGIDDAVTVTGRLEPLEVLDRLAAADLYVAPAFLESFGLAALEARSVGLPVVGRTGTGLPDFIHERRNGLLCDSDRAMVAALVELVEDTALRHRISEHNRTTSAQLGWTHSLERHEAAYSLAVGEAEARAALPALQVVHS